MRVNARAARALIRAGLARELPAPPAAAAAVTPTPEAQARPRRVYRRRDIEQAPEAVVLQAETLPGVEPEPEPEPSSTTEE